MIAPFKKQTEEIYPTMMFPAIHIPSKITYTSGTSPCTSPNSRYKNLDLEPNQVFSSSGQPMKKIETIPRSSFVELCGEIFLSPADDMSSSAASGASSQQQFQEQQQFDFETSTITTSTSSVAPSTNDDNYDDDDSKLTEYDILVGRHKNAFNHVGNRRFRVVISSFLPKYFDSPSRTHRARLVLEIIEAIQRTGGRFVKGSSKGDGGALVELNDKEKRNKVGHALRDAARAHINNKKGSTTMKTTTTTTTDNVVTSAAKFAVHNHLVVKKQQHHQQLERLQQQHKEYLSLQRSNLHPINVAPNLLPNIAAVENDNDSLFDDDSIGVDFPIDLNLLLSMP